MKAIVLGSTGAVGRALVNELTTNSAKWDEVRAITRREYQFDIQSPKFSQRVVDFNSLDEYKSDLQGYDTIFVAMGTTRASAGGAENFVRIDQDLTVDATRAALTDGRKQHILYVSASGASESSPMLYSKSKGQTERRLKELGAASTTIFRPGMLELQQSREESRLAETIFRPMISKLRYLGINSMSSNVAEVAKAMRLVAEDGSRAETGVVSNTNILALCQE